MHGDSDFNGGAHFNATEVLAAVEHGTEGSETVLGYSWRKNGEATAGERGMGESPQAHSPTSGRSQAAVKAWNTQELSSFSYPSRSSKTPTPGHLGIYSHMKYRHTTPSSQAGLWPWSYGEVIH